MGNKHDNLGSTWPDGPKGYVSRRAYRRTLESLRDVATSLAEQMTLQIRMIEDEDRAEERDERRARRRRHQSADANGGPTPETSVAREPTD
jgi:hypothetical protein